MSIPRAIIIASISLGLTPAIAQQREATTAPAFAQPPLFQGIMVDAKGKTVGRVLGFGSGTDNAIFSKPDVGIVVRQVNGSWVAALASVDGFQISDPSGSIVYLFQSADCTGTTYLRSSLPVTAVVLTEWVATQPTLFFPGAPINLSIGSYVVGAIDYARIHQGICNNCCMPLDTAVPMYVCALQSVAVSTFGLTPPFNVK